MALPHVGLTRSLEFRRGSETGTAAEAVAQSLPVPPLSSSSQGPAPRERVPFFGQQVEGKSPRHSCVVTPQTVQPHVTRRSHSLVVRDFIHPGQGCGPSGRAGGTADSLACCLLWHPLRAPTPALVPPLLLQCAPFPLLGGSPVGTTLALRLCMWAPVPHLQTPGGGALSGGPGHWLAPAGRLILCGTGTMACALARATFNPHHSPG